MNLNQVQWFCHAYETHSFAKAAESEFVSRQAFGKGIKSMEHELGISLFERDSSGVKPTTIAETIYPQAKICLKNYQDILRLCGKHAPDKKTKIKIAIADGMVGALPDGFLDDMEIENPQIEFLIEKHFATRCLELLRKKQVDFAISSGPIEDDFLGQIPLARHSIFVAAAKKLLVFPTDQPTFENLSTLTFFMLGDGFPNDRRFIETFNERGLTLRTNNQYRDYDIVLKEVERGHGASIIPDNCLDQISDTELAIMPFPDPEYRWEIEFFYPKQNHSPEGRRLIDFIKTHSLVY